MRTRTILLARVSLLGVCMSALGSCTPLVERPILRILAEQPVFVELPPNGSIISAIEKAKYENNPFTVEHLERRCTQKPIAPNPCSSPVELRITVIEGAKAIRAGGHGPRAHLIAVIVNKGPTQTFDHLLPGKQFLVGVADGNQTALMRVQFNPISGSPDFRVDSRRYGTVIPCHPTYSSLSSDASFRGCPEDWKARQIGPREGVLATSQVSVEMQHSFMQHRRMSTTHSADFASLDDPLWLRCTPGCCTS